MDRQAIRDELRRLIQDTDSNAYRWTDAVLNTRIDQSHERISALTKCIIDLDNTANIVSGTSAYAIPTGFLEAISIRVKDGSDWYSLGKVTVEELDARGDDWRSSTGNPTHYYVLGGYINLFPIPDTSVASGMSVDMYARPTAFTSDTNIPFNSDATLYAYHDIISYDVAMKCKQDERKHDEAKQFYDIVQIKLREIKYQLASTTEDTRMVNIYEETRENSLR